ncbi:MAG TPA: ArsA family ATPase [Acidimicrobiales bacterium]|nr:ArsA family ATPase [Acidimicrobiales bacterium]
MSALRELAATHGVIVCCGSGGVGKTTTAAALAIEGARRGRRACVVTIDPARRLADALGLDALTNTPGTVEGDWPGQLSALMLDTKTTFDQVVARYAATADQAERIISNGLYRNISGALSGTQEYMAMEKLFELHDSGDYDLIVIDTPPTRNALDFLDAPRRLTKFLDNRIFRLLVMPTRAYLKAVGAATQAVLKTISKVVGTEVVGDAVAFFRAFEGMEEGFRNRAQEVLELLAADETAFVVVTSPRRDAVIEAVYFAERLDEAGLGVDGLIVNRVHPTFGATPGGPVTAPNGASPELVELYENLRDFVQVAGREVAHVAEVAEKVAPAPVAKVPYLVDDVHDVAGLGQILQHL